MTQHQIKSERTLEEYIILLRKMRGPYLGDGVNQSINAYDLANKIESLLQQNIFTQIHSNFQGDFHASN